MDGDVTYGKGTFVASKGPSLFFSADGASWGEATVSVTGKGKGGRNQEFMLQALIEMSGIRHPFFILSMGSDGIDGQTDAAGAWIDENSARQSASAGMIPEKFLLENDSYHFFSRLKQSVITGITPTNVMDFRMFYIPGAE